MSDLVVRPYRAGDEEGVNAVLKTVFEEYDFPWQPEGYNADTHNIEKHYLEAGGAFWVAEFGSTIVGTGGLLPIDEETCELHRMYVLSEFRGMGAGKSMFAAIVREARARNYKLLTFWSDKVLTAAHRFYESHGAKRVAERQVEDEGYASYCEWGYCFDLTRASADSRS